MDDNGWIKKFFEERVYRTEWDEKTDKEIIYNDFVEYVENLSFIDRVRIRCYSEYCSVSDFGELGADISESTVKNTASRLNRKLEVEVKKVNSIKHYKLSNRGLKQLMLNISSFYRNNKYLIEFTRHEIDIEKFDTKDVIKGVVNFYTDYMENKIRAVIDGDKNYLDVDFMEICEFDYKLSELLLQNPIDILSIFESTLNNVFTTEFESRENRIRLYNVPDTEKVKIGSQREKHVDKLVVFEGIIRRKSGVKIVTKHIAYLCTNPSCSFSENKIIVPQFEEKMKTLKVCPKCKSGVELVDEVREDSMYLILEQDFSERGEDFDSKKIHIKLNKDLTSEKEYSRLRISEKIQVIGILKSLNKQTKGGAQSINYDYILEANNIIFLKDEEDIILSKEDIQEIQEFAKHSDCFLRMRQSYIPKVYGNTLIKEAMILQHIGSSYEHERNNSHILLLGDPSTAKTEMIYEDLTYGTRYVYASGTSSTKAGMTAVAVKDELTGSWALEGGVLPRANGGIAGCDELDKLSPEDADGLTEALEQQRISVNKAGISAQLQTKCAFIAGANPKYGKFDNSMEITKQIKFNPALLSRFDLIFIMRDSPDKARDELLIGHVLNPYTSISNDDYGEELSKDFIKKYLYYVKTNFTPVLGEKAVQLVKKYYVTVRHNMEMNHYISFTPRQVKGVIRLATAYAKFHQKNIVDEKCIKYAFDLVNRVIEQLGTTNMRAIERTMSNSSSDSVKEILKYFLDSETSEHSLDQIKKQFNELSTQEINKALEQLKKDKEVYEPRKDVYVLVRN